MEKKTIQVGDYLEVIQNQISELIRNFNEKDYIEYENNFDTLKNILQTFTGNPGMLYPLINSLFQMVFNVFTDDPSSEINCKFLSVTGHYVGQVFEYYKDLKSAMNAYAYSFFLFDIQAITKLITIQILQLLNNNDKLAIETNQIISGLSNEILLIKDKFSLNNKEINITDALEILDLAIKLSNNIIYWSLIKMNSNQKEIIEKKIQNVQKQLLINGIKIYNLSKNLNELFSNNRF